jgi:hypothetical protein
VNNVAEVGNIRLRLEREHIERAAPSWTHMIKTDGDA